MRAFGSIFIADICHCPRTSQPSGDHRDHGTNTVQARIQRARILRQYGIGHDNAYRAIREGKLVARKYGKRTIITAHDADKFIASLPRLELPPIPETEDKARPPPRELPAAHQRVKAGKAPAQQRPTAIGGADATGPAKT